MTEVVPPRARVATFGGIDTGPAAPPRPDGPDFAAIHASPAFAALRSRFRRFVFGMSAVFFVWYLTYVLLAAYAPGFMATRISGSVTIGLVLGLLQFATTVAITAGYLRWARAKLDPDVVAIRAAAGVDEAVAP